jgi:alkylation response protein AidB-like acyl-CoA dehydrogenase
MDLDFTTEQRMIQQEARQFLTKEIDTDFVREMWEDDTGLTDKLWKKFAEMGWLGITIPEEYEGAGCDFLDLGIILDEMGRVPMPGPFLSTVIAGELLVDAGTEDQKNRILPRIVQGDIKATIAVSEPEYATTAEGIQLTATSKGDGFVLNGKKQFVMDGIASDLMIIAARTEKGADPEHGITLFLLEGEVPGVTKRPLITMDGGRKQCEVLLENVEIPTSQILGKLNAGWPVLNHLFNKAALAVAMESLGAAESALNKATAYAKERVQFDRPIGSFQAIKHMCAQCMVELEGARSICYYAAWAMDHLKENESALIASMAKAYASDMFRKVTSDAIQVHGAIGVTWENDMHLYLKRAKMNETLFGDPGFHRERVAQLLNF